MTPQARCARARRVREVPADLQPLRLHQRPPRLDEREDSRSWTIGVNPILFPYLLGFGPGSTGIRRSYQFGVPIDDTTTWHMQYFCYDFPAEVGVPQQDFVPYAEVPLTDEQRRIHLDYVSGKTWSRGTSRVRSPTARRSTWRRATRA